MSALENEKMCRLCRKRGVNYIPIFGEREPVIDQIIRCLPIMVERHDGLPDHICPGCFGCLTISYKLHILSTKTDNILRKKLSTIKTEEIDFEEAQSTQLKTETVKNQEVETELIVKNEEVQFEGTQQNSPKSEITLPTAEAEDVQNPFNVNYTATPVVLDVFHLPQMVFDSIDNENDFNNNKTLPTANYIERDSIGANNRLLSVPQCIDEQSSEMNKENIESANVSDVPTASFLQNEDSTRSAMASGKRGRQLSLQDLPLKKRLRIESNEQCAETIKNDGFIGRYQFRQNTKCSYNYDDEEVVSLEDAVCNLCDKRFRTKAALQRHNKVKHAPRGFGCDKCDAVFRKKEYLEKHKKHHLSSDEWQFQCHECGDKFPFMSTLRSHQKQGHTRIPSFACVLCNRSFFSKAAVESHKSFIHHSIRRKR